MRTHVHDAPPPACRAQEIDPYLTRTEARRQCEESAGGCGGILRALASGNGERTGLRPGSPYNVITLTCATTDTTGRYAVAVRQSPGVGLNVTARESVARDLAAAVGTLVVPLGAPVLAGTQQVRVPLSRDTLEVRVVCLVAPGADSDVAFQLSVARILDSD